jgi:uncharacterized protein (TIGR03067 family)
MKPHVSRSYRLSLLAVIFAALTGCLGCGGGDSKGGGDPDLDGTWVGKEVGDDYTIWTYSLAASGSVDVTTSTGDEWYKGTYTADTASDPKQWTGKITACPYPPYVGATSHAIYKIEGTTLTFAGNEPGDSAVPTSFSDGHARVYVLTKQ